MGLDGKLNLLFVCGRNRWRSPTASQIYRDDRRFEVRSAGLSESSRYRLSEKDLEWADWVLVMERKHCSRVHDLFRSRRALPPIDALEIPDDYPYMDPELILLIRDATEHLWESRSW